jgi:hypothetical protein
MVRMDPHIITTRDAARAAYQAKAFDLNGRRFLVKQTVEWGAVPTNDRLQLSLKDDRLVLVGCDYRGREYTTGLAERTLRFLNTDLQLTLPERSLCQAAKEWLEKIGSRLFLQLSDLPQVEGQTWEIGTFMRLLAAVDPERGEHYGLLVLND